MFLTMCFHKDGDCFRTDGPEQVHPYKLHPGLMTRSECET